MGVLTHALQKGAGLPCPWVTSSRSQTAALDLGLVETVSRAVRSLLWEVSPEIVSVAEGFASEVVYIPVSATVQSGARPAHRGLRFRPRDVKPMWAEVPLVQHEPVDAGPGAVSPAGHGQREIGEATVAVGAASPADCR